MADAARFGMGRCVIWLYTLDAAGHVMGGHTVVLEWL